MSKKAKRKIHRYTEEQEKFLKTRVLPDVAISKAVLKNLADSFNKEFGTNISPAAIYAKTAYLKGLWQRPVAAKKPLRKRPEKQAQFLKELARAPLADSNLYSDEKKKHRKRRRKSKAKTSARVQKHVWTKDQERCLKDLARNPGKKDVAEDYVERFNNMFKTTITPQQLRMKWMHVHGLLKKGKKSGSERIGTPVGHQFTQEQMKFLKRVYPHILNNPFDRETVIRDFNERFNTNLASDEIMKEVARVQEMMYFEGQIVAVPSPEQLRSALSTSDEVGGKAEAIAEAVADCDRVFVILVNGVRVWQGKGKPDVEVFQVRDRF